MHDQAKLVNGTGKVAPVGAYVTIDKVELIYKTSAAANASESFQCSNPKCNVKVIAVITQLSKPGRKLSPSSYFRAWPKPHVAGCDRQPAGTTASSSASGTTKAASPTRTTVPTRWVPPSGSSTAAAATSTGTTRAGASSGGVGQISASGNGTNTSSSSRVEVFSPIWKSMAPATRAGTAFGAPWNPGGSYDSAFHDLAAIPLAATAPSPVRIYRGTVSGVHLGRSGYSVTLVQRHADSRDLVFWVQNPVQHSNPSGKTAWARLVAGLATGTEIFALGCFSEEVRPTRSWYSLPVNDGHDIWIP